MLPRNDLSFLFLHFVWNLYLVFKWFIICHFFLFHFRACIQTTHSECFFVHGTSFTRYRQVLLQELEFNVITNFKGSRVVLQVIDGLWEKEHIVWNLHYLILDNDYKHYAKLYCKLSKTIKLLIFIY